MSIPARFSTSPIGRPYRMSERVNFLILLAVAAVAGAGVTIELLRVLG